MLHPSYKEMIEKLNETAGAGDEKIASRYALVLAAAKRARQINSINGQFLDENGQPVKRPKNLSVAVEEMFAGNIHILDEQYVPEKEIESAEEETEEAVEAEVNSEEETEENDEEEPEA